MNITSVMYRGFEIVSMPSGHRLIHRAGEPRGPLIRTLEDDESALPIIDRLVVIGTLNDLARTAMGVASILFPTEGIKHLPPADQSRIRELVEQFDDFNADNDPHGERDFGSFDHAGHRIMWKIDYYNADLTAGSEDEADPKQTRRVLTIMLASEY